MIDAVTPIDSSADTTPEAIAIDNTTVIVVETHESYLAAECVNSQQRCGLRLKSTGTVRAGDLQSLDAFGKLQLKTVHMC